MDITQLRSVVAIAALGNLSRAAQSLHLSQPAVSAHVRQLEEELGLTLFERHARGMRLTPEGERIHAHALAAVAAMAAIKDEAGAISGRLSGTLTIGTISGSVPLRLAAFLKLARERAPDVEISLVQSTSGKVLRGVLDGSLDAGFVEGEAEGADLRRALLTHVEYVVAYPAPWQERLERAGKNGIFTLPWIGTPEDCSLHRLTAALFASHGQRFRPTVRTDQEALLLDLVRQEAGVALLGRAVLQDAANPPSVRILPDISVSAALQFVSSLHTPKQALVSFAHRAMGEAWGT